MQSICPVCEIRVNEKDGEFRCPKCKASWKEPVWKKRSLTPKRPGWFVRNNRLLKRLITALGLVIVLSVGVLMTMKPVLVI